VIGLISGGTAAASSRTMGHTISLWITACLMLLVIYMIGRDAAWGPRSYAPSRWTRYGPVATCVLAATLIMVEPTRHVINDQNLWPWCGNNPTYDRINSTDAFPPQCDWSATQYVCTQQCCVSTWQPTDPNETAFSWLPPTGDFFPAGPLPGPFGTRRADGTIYVPDGAGHGPFALYGASAKAPLVFYETGALNPLKVDAPATGCMYGTNPLTGYCFLTNQSLSYEEQLLQLPLADPKAAFNATANPHVCACDGCVPDEDFSHLSVVGVLSTIVCTYVGFALLAVAVGWNANVVSKFAKIGQQWRALRGR